MAAPMTSKQQSITSMISVVAEGRCALLATYQIFQFIVGYAMAQAFATNLMYTHALQMGNYQYLIGVSEPSTSMSSISTACSLGLSRQGLQPENGGMEGGWEGGKEDQTAAAVL